MSVRAKRGHWPDRDGDYQIVEDKVNGSVLHWVDRGTYGPDTEAVAERILAAINDDTVPAPTLPDDLPSWVSMHATATGADLIEHDPNGEEWERSWVGKRWNTNHNAAAERDRRYLVRRRPVPVEPTTEKVPWWEAVERGLAVIGRDGEFVMDCGAGDVVAYLDGARWALMYDDASHEELKRPLADPDGMVTVLREDGAS